MTVFQIHHQKHQDNRTAQLVVTEHQFYDNLLFFQGPYTKMEKLLKRLMEHFNWKRVAIIASTDDIWQIAANLVKIELLRHGISVAHFHSFIPGRLHILESRIVRHAELIQKAAKRAMSKLM